MQQLNVCGEEYVGYEIESDCLTELELKLMEAEGLTDEEFQYYEDELGLMPHWRPMISFLVKGLGCSMEELEKVSETQDRGHSTPIPGTFVLC